MIVAASWARDRHLICVIEIIVESGVLIVRIVKDHTEESGRTTASTAAATTAR